MHGQSMHVSNSGGGFGNAVQSSNMHGNTMYNNNNNPSVVLNMQPAMQPAPGMAGGGMLSPSTTQILAKLRTNMNNIGF
jgi:hypothetical protein